MFVRPEAAREAQVRVLTVIDSLVPGGAETSLAILAPALVEAGVDLEVAHLHDRPGLQDRFDRSGIPRHDLSAGGGRRGWTRELRRLIADRRPDGVHTTLYESDVCGRLAARSRRTPVSSSLVTERYGEGHLGHPGLSVAKVRAAQVVDVATARLTTRLHAVSHAVADAMSGHLRYPRSRIDVVGRARPVPDVPDPDAVRADVRAELGTSAGAGVVLSVARLGYEKGVDRLLDAFETIAASDPDAELWLAGGDGGAADDVRARVAAGSGDGRVRLLGHRTDVDHLHAAADVFVLPSRREGAPGALIEAMAMGSAAVAVGIAPVREVVDERSARLVTPGDTAELADAVRGLLADPEARSALGTAARQRFGAHYSIPVVARDMAAFFDRAYA